MKTFLFTLILVLVVVLTTYIALYSFLPTFYYNLKKSNLEKQADELIVALKKSNINFYNNIINDFMVTNNLFVIPVDENGIPVSNLGAIIELKNFVKQSSQTMETTRNLPNSNVNLVVFSNLQPITEAREVLLKMLPYAILFSIIIAAIGSFIYSKRITNPILKISDTANKMANMEYCEKAYYGEEDEIGSLAKNLNLLYENLYNTIEEVKESNEKLKVEMEHVKELQKFKSDFMAAVSHELKTPIAGASGILEGMIDEIGIYKDRDKYLRECRRLMGRTSILVKELIDVSYIDSESLILSKENIDLNSLIKDILMAYEYQIEIKDIKINAENLDFSIYSDKKLITKAISNIILNAIQYTDEGKNIFIKACKEDNNLILSIENEGSKIDEKNKDKLFEPFYREDKSRSRNTGGNGLGLYIVKEIFKVCSINFSIENSDIGVKFKMEMHTQNTHKSLS